MNTPIHEFVVPDAVLHNVFHNSEYHNIESPLKRISLHRKRALQLLSLFDIHPEHCTEFTCINQQIGNLKGDSRALARLLFDVVLDCDNKIQYLVALLNDRRHAHVAQLIRDHCPEAIDFLPIDF